MLILILAKQDDETAIWLANRWQSHDIAVVSPCDLSRSGWVHYAGASQRSRLRLGKVDAREEDVSGVLVRIASVEAGDLQHIVERDRSYVAAEMTAFLLAWLSGFARPVLNRPTPQDLGGPALRREQWVQVAKKMGIPCLPVCRNTLVREVSCEDNRAFELIVVGRACFGEGDQILKRHALQLAARSGVDVLSTSFTGLTGDSEFVTANPRPDLRSPQIADAVLAWFEERALC